MGATDGLSDCRARPLPVPFSFEEINGLCALDSKVFLKKLIEDDGRFCSFNVCNFYF